ncbi:MAG TPA: hypothetical protein VMG34_10475 [Bacteroidota bacterium]|nr:hypothetical protein [Bacteroidota bacterium]
MNGERVNRERKATVLFVSHRERQCGVYQFGLNIAGVLRTSQAFNFVPVACSSAEDLRSEVREHAPSAIIYNYHPITMGWLGKGIVKLRNVPNIGIIHEVHQSEADAATNKFFDYFIAPDPTLLLRNPLVFKTGRFVPRFEGRSPLPAGPVIGSFGFGTPGKGFDRLVLRVQEEYDEATIRLHIPFATFGDADGAHARAIAEQCRSLVKKPGVRLVVDHDFMEDRQLLEFLSQNTLNAFLYDQNSGRGISSVIDYALAVRRPIAITRSNMFRHILHAEPSICVEDRSLRDIAASGFEPLLPFSEDWSVANLLWDYERIVRMVLERKLAPRPSLVRRAVRKFIRLAKQTEKTPERWSPSTASVIQEESAGDAPRNYAPTFEVRRYNRILDDSARELYAPAIEFLSASVPEMIARKIPRANIQQAFVFDTVARLYAKTGARRILCVGSYEDTASATLRKTGIRIEEIDPVLNYDLETFCTRPSTRRAGYDIVFSTSVIEHVRQDERFVALIGELLAPGGTAVLTCDFNDAYKPGDPIPAEDFRFYTQRDLRTRLLPAMAGCRLVGEPAWECERPDFSFGGCQYTFATFVVRKEILPEP